ncbi:MAG: ACT domain-containing protein [Ruminococcus sp.]|nr:ACT domain-containing protein [Ruminococcus sp.]
MELELLDHALTVCKVNDLSGFDFGEGFYFIGKTDEELSLVCRTDHAPANTTYREDGWRGFRVVGQLDFSLTGILSRLSAVLAEEQVGIFAYILVKEKDLEKACKALTKAGYVFI